MIRVTVAFPTSGILTARFTAALAALCLADTQFYKINKISFRQGCYVHSNRNQIVKTFLESKDSEWLLQIDPDLSFGYDLLQRLLLMARLKEGKVAAGWYMNTVEMQHGKKQIIPLVFKYVKDGMYMPQMPEGEQPISVDAVATGCLLVHREVYEKTKRSGPSPWFDFGVTVNGDLVGEDMFFSKLVKDAGYEIWVDPKLQLKHYKMLEV